MLRTFLLSLFFNLGDLVAEHGGFLEVEVGGGELHLRLKLLIRLGSSS